MKRFATVVLTLICLSCAAATNEPVIGGPCDGCEVVFVEMPTRINSSARIAPTGQKGEALVLEGMVRNPDRTPAKDVIVYAYHTDAGGLYPAGTTRHGKLRGWARSNAKGHYRFETIRPGAYPARDNPQHIHMHVIERGKATYTIDDVTFTDDPLLTAEQKKNEMRSRRLWREPANTERARCLACSP